MSVKASEDVPALPLSRKRRFLGVVIPILNLSVFALAVYDTLGSLMSGASPYSLEFIGNLIILVVSFVLGFHLPRWAPVYESRYRISREGIALTRLLRGSVTIPFEAVSSVEIYVRIKSQGEISKEALQYARVAAESLRQRGLKFSDYTNAEEVIALLITENRVYMISPEDPKSLVKRLRGRIPDLRAKLIELTPKGKRMRDI